MQFVSNILWGTAFDDDAPEGAPCLFVKFSFDQFQGRVKHGIERAVRIRTGETNNDAL